MLEYIKSLGALPIQWGEADDDGEAYTVVWHGEIIRASTPALLLGELQARNLDWQVAA